MEKLKISIFNLKNRNENNRKCCVIVAAVRVTLHVLLS